MWISEVFFIVWSEQPVRQTVESSVIWDAVMLMWRHSNVNYVTATWVPGAAVLWNLPAPDIQMNFIGYIYHDGVHYIGLIITTIASQITSLTVVYSTVYSDADQRKQQSSASLAFVWGIHRDRWIPRTKGQLSGNVSIWWRHHAL